MEITVSCLAGLLVGCGVNGVALLCCGDDGSAPPHAPPRVRWGRGILRSVGTGAMGSGVLPERAQGRWIAELRRVRMGSQTPFASFGEGEALGAVALGSVGCGVLTGLVSLSPWGIPAGFMLPGAILTARGGMHERDRRRRVEQAMPEAFGALAVSLGSGLSLSQAMRYVGGHAVEPVGSEFVRVACSIECGVPATEALDKMIGRLDAPGLEMVTLALAVSQRTGAPLKDVLSEATRMVGDRIELARRLDVKTSQARMSARLVACMPAVMISFLSLLSSDFQKGVATVPGALCVAAALALNATAWAIIRSIMKVRL